MQEWRLRFAVGGVFRPILAMRDRMVKPFARGEANYVLT